MNELKNTLIEIGLSEKEALIYLSILKVSTASLTNISEASGIKRTTLYGYIDILLNKWFIIKVVKSKRILYKASNPENILKDMQKKSNVFSKNLPKLIEIYEQSSSKPSFVVHEKLSGIKSIYKEIQEGYNNIYAIVSAQAFTENIKLNDRLQFLEWIKKNGNKIYNLAEDNIEWRKFAKEYAKGEMSLRFLPKEFNISTDILIYGNKTAFISFKNLNWVVINNKEIADCMKWLHQIAWKK